MAETPEAIVEHLKENHLHAIPPRFHKGNYKKVKEKPAPIRPVIQQSVSPISFISSKIFSYLAYTVHMPTQQYHSHNLTLRLDSEEHVLPPFSSIRLSNAMAINCGGCILSSAFHATEDRLFIAIGCVDNPTVPPSNPSNPSNPDPSTVSTVSTVSTGLNGLHLPYPRRSFHSQRSEVPENAGWLSIYETQKHNQHVTHTLHIACPHSFPVQLCWLPLSLLPSDSMGILAALLANGDLCVFHIPRSSESDLWVDLDPVVHIHFTRRITAFAVHPLYGEVLLAGLEDGSLRSIALHEQNDQFHWVGQPISFHSDRSQRAGAAARMVRRPPHRVDCWNSTKRRRGRRLRYCFHGFHD